MSLSSVTPCPTTVEKIGMLIALLFVFIALPIAVRRRRLGVALTLVPLLANGAVGYALLMRVMEVRAMIGRPSVAAISAGVASAQVPLMTGAAFAAATALLMAFFAWRRPSAERSNRLALAIALAGLALAAAEPLMAFPFARSTPASMVPVWYALEAAAAVTAIGTLAAVFASRGAAARPLLIAAAGEGAIGLEAWLVMRHFEQIALHGIA